MRELQPCGTAAAYQRHKKRREPVDEACQEAWRRWQASYRAANQDVADKERAYKRVRSAAMYRLAKEYPARFVEIFDALMAIDRTSR